MKDRMKLSLSPKLLEKLVWQGPCILVEGSIPSSLPVVGSIATSMPAPNCHSTIKDFCVEVVGVGTIGTLVINTHLGDQYMCHFKNLNRIDVNHFLAY